MGGAADELRVADRVRQSNLSLDTETEGDGGRKRKEQVEHQSTGWGTRREEAGRTGGSVQLYIELRRTRL